MPDISRKSFLTLAGVTGLTVVSLSACSSITGKGSSSGGVLTIGAQVGSDANTANIFPENFNVFGGGQSAPGTGLFFETLFRISQTDGGKLIPNLAETVEYSDGGRTATYKLRKGVKWNDGKPFTADDVVFTYGFVFGPAGPPDPKDPSNTPFLRKPVEKKDDYTVLVHYNDPNYQEDTNLSAYYPIYAAHIYKKVKSQKTYVDKSPVGTGPGKLKSFTEGRIEVDIRDDYWGGKSQGVKTVVIVPQGTVGNIQSQITRGKVDWADGGGQGVLTNFLGQSKSNRYEYWPDGSNTGVQFLCTKEPTNDTFVRKALRDAIDFTAIRTAVGIGYPIPSLTGLDPKMYGSLIIDGYDKPEAQNVQAAKAALSDGGWSVVGGNLTKGGKAYPLEILVDLGQPVHIQIAPMLISYWKEQLGISVAQVNRADTVFQKEVGQQLHTMAIWNVNLGGSAYNAYEGYSHANLGAAQQAAGYGNQGRWRAPDATNDALATLQSTPSTDLAQIKKQLQIIQQSVIDEAPFVPLYPGGGGEMTTVKNWTAWPKSGSTTFPPRTGGYDNIIQTLMKLKPAQA